MNKEEIKKIEKRLALLPRLEVRETILPRMIRDKNSGKMITDPRGGAVQVRLDIIDLDDPAHRPWIHFHTYLDHPLYIPDAKATGEALAHLIQDAKDLVSEIKKLQGELNDRPSNQRNSRCSNRLRKRK